MLPSWDDLDCQGWEIYRRLMRRHEGLFFLGDADPPDLLTFAWLRAHTSIAYLGVNDQFLHNHFIVLWTGRTYLYLNLSLRPEPS